MPEENPLDLAKAKVIELLQLTGGYRDHEFTKENVQRIGVELKELLEQASSNTSTE